MENAIVKELASVIPNFSERVLALYEDRFLMQSKEGIQVSWG